MKLIFLLKYNRYVFYIFLLLSFWVHTKYGLYIKPFGNSLKISLIGILGYFILLRIIYMFSQRESLSDLLKNNIIIFIYPVVNILSVLMSQQINFLNLFHPIIFLITILGLKAFLDLEENLYDLIPKLFVVFIAFSLGHILFNFIFISNTLASGWFLNSGNFLGITDNSNIFGIEMMLGAFSAIVLFLLLKEKKVKFVFLILQIVFIVMIIFCKSRASLLAVSTLYALVLFFGIFYNRSYSLITKKNIVLLLLFVAPFILFLFFFNNVYTGFLGKLSHGSSSRVDMWIDFLKYNFKIFPDSGFWFGHGIDEFRVIKFTEIPGFYKYGHLHNLYLDIWAKKGLFTMIAMLFFIIAAFVKGMKIKKYYWIFLIIPAYLTHQIFEMVLFLRILRWEAIYFYIIILIPFVRREPALLDDNGE